MVAKPPLRRRASLTVDVPLALLGTSARMPHHATTDAPVAPVFGHTHAPWVVHLPYLSHSPLSLSDPQPGHDANALLGGQPQFSLPVRQVRGLVQGQNHIHPAMEQTGGESSLATQPHPAAALSSRTQLPHPAAAPSCRTQLPSLTLVYSVKGCPWTRLCALYTADRSSMRSATQPRTTATPTRSRTARTETRRCCGGCTRPTPSFLGICRGLLTSRSPTERGGTVTRASDLFRLCFVAF